MKFALALLAVLLSATLISAPKEPFNSHDKAYYADANTVNFVRPGLVISITSTTIAANGTITARFKLTDPKGLGLDRLGITTPGNVSVSFIAATIPAGQTQYTAYTTRVQGPTPPTSPIVGATTTQAGGESNGVFTQVGDGDYTYTFVAKAPSTIDRTATHTIGAYGSRNLTEFDMGTYYDDAVFNFVPDGSQVKVVRDVIKTQTCNKCHDSLGVHGGSRKSVELCVLCHQPQTMDPDTGVQVDFKQMIHKIHTGPNLPSVKAGKKYIIIGNAQSVNDFSDTTFPGYPDTRNCTICHEQNTGAAQKEAYLKPSRAACGSCHDDVNFATGENHVNLPQVSDNQCANCHTPQGELEFDASVMGAHTVPLFSKDAPGNVFQILSVDGAGPGKKPTVTFSVKDKKGNPVDASKMARLALVMGGPNTDYTTNFSEDARTAKGSGDGTYVWTMANALPANAKSSWTMGMEGYTSVTLLPGTTKSQVIRDSGANVTYPFSVDGSKVVARRQAVATSKCTVCHVALQLHGGMRNQVEQCVICHNPTATDTSQRPASQNPPQSINFSSMIHRIHTGKDLTIDFTIFGFGGAPINFNDVGFPGDRRDCNVCHVNDAQQLPLPDTNINATDPRGPLNPIGPTAAACTGCHTTIQTASHALVNTTTLGESCSVCHGPNAEFAVDKVHAH